jgi:hypothetical protein
MIKRKVKSQIGNSLKARVKSSPIGACNTPLERSFKGYKLSHFYVKKRLDLRKI